jgi:hypothetical protein
MNVLMLLQLVIYSPLVCYAIHNLPRAILPWWDWYGPNSKSKASNLGQYNYKIVYLCLSVWFIFLCCVCYTWDLTCMPKARANKSPPSLMHTTHYPHMAHHNPCKNSTCHTHLAPKTIHTRKIHTSTHNQYPPHTLPRGSTI